MKKSTIAEKALEQTKIQEQWAFYEKMFGPVLTPAYAEDAAARIHVINILNKIGRREGMEARKAMETLKKKGGIPGAAEATLWHFLQGLLADAEGNVDGMADKYAIVMQRLPEYYLPLQKVALHRQKQCRYEEAAALLDRAIGLRYQQRSMDMALAGLYANLAMCQIAMHRSEEAERALSAADRFGIYPTESVWALLHAVRGNSEEALRLCKQGRAALVYPQVKDILDGVHPQFCEQPIDTSSVVNFTDWMTDNAASLDAMDDASASEALSKQLMRVFPALVQYPAAAEFHTADGLRTLTLRDYFGKTPIVILDLAANALTRWPIRREH